MGLLECPIPTCSVGTASYLTQLMLTTPIKGTHTVHQFNDNNKSHQPLEGELRLKFTGPTILRSWMDISIMFNDPSISIHENPSLITCSKANCIDIRRAKALLSNLTRLMSSTKPTFVHDVGPGDIANLRSFRL